MTFPPEGAARSLCMAADEALTAAAFCTGDFAEAELAAGHPRRAAERLNRAVTLAREASLLPWRIRDAEQNLREAEAIARSTD